MELAELINQINDGDIEKLRVRLGEPNVSKLLNRPINEGEYALHVAARSNNPAIVELLLQAGANPNQESEETGTHLGYSAAHYAASNGDIETLRILFNYKAGLGRTSADLWTPLHLAAYKGHSAVIAFLLEKGVDVDCLNNYKQTPLVFSVSHGRVRDVRLLLRNNADVNFRDLSNDTLLHHAFQYQMSKLFEGEYDVPESQFDIGVVLVLAGVNPEVVNVDGHLATHYMKKDVPTLPSVLKALSDHASKLQQAPAEWNYLTLVTMKWAYLTNIGFTEEEAKSLCELMSRIESERLAVKKRKEERQPSGGCPVMHGKKHDKVEEAKVPEGEHPKVTQAEIDEHLRRGTDPSKGQCPFFKKQPPQTTSGAETAAAADVKDCKCPLSLVFAARHQTTILLVCLSFVLGMWVDQCINRLM